MQCKVKRQDSSLNVNKTVALLNKKPLTLNQAFEVMKKKRNRQIWRSRSFHTTLPRISEKIASKTIGKLIGVSGIFTNFSAFRKETVSKFNLKGGETFGAEFLVIAKKKGLAIGEIKYDPPPRRKNPRIGGTIKANLRIIWALIKSLTIYIM